MQNWPYVDLGYINVEHFRSMPQKNDSVQKWEYLTAEVVLVPGSGNAVMFFDHYTKEYKGQRSELDAYLEKLRADDWKLTIAGNIFDGKAYQFRRANFRRAVG